MIDDRTIRVWEWIAHYTGTQDLPVSLGGISLACVERTRMDGAWITRGHTVAESAHATDDVAERLEELHFGLGEGPATDAAEHGQAVLVDDLSSTVSHGRWPVFAPAAVTTGARSVFATPMRVGAARIGVFALYSHRVTDLSGAQQADIGVFADIALALVLDGAERVRGDRDRWFDDSRALKRAEVHQATGIVSAQLGVSVTESLVRLRAHAFTHERPLIEIARDIVNRRLRFSRKMPTTPPGVTEKE